MDGATVFSKRRKAWVFSRPLKKHDQLILQPIIIYLWLLILGCFCSQMCTLKYSFYQAWALKPETGTEKYQDNKVSADAFPWLVLRQLPSKPKMKAGVPISAVSTCTHFMISTAWTCPKLVISQQRDSIPFLNQQSMSRSSNCSMVLSRSYPLQFKGCVLKKNLKTESTINQQVASEYHLGKQYQILCLYFPTSVLTKLYHFALHWYCIRISKWFIYHENAPLIRGKEILHSSQIWKCMPHKVCNLTVQRLNLIIILTIKVFA